MRAPCVAASFPGQALRSHSGQQKAFLCRSMAPREGRRLGKAADRSEFSSMSHLVCRRARQKRACVHRQSAVHEASEQRQTAPGSALATPVARNATLTSDRRSSSHLRAAASDRRAPPSSTRARASSVPRRALGPASAPSPAATFVGPFREKRRTRINNNESFLGRRRLRL